MKNRRPVLIFLLLMLTPACFSVLGKPQSDPRQQIEAINRQLQQTMLQSNQHLEQGEYQQAESDTKSLLKDLDQLIEVVMPLGERINRLLVKEEAILEQTRQASERLIADQLTSNLEEELQGLGQDQKGNGTKTDGVVKMIDSQLQSDQAKQPNSGRQEEQLGADKIKTLKEIRRLLKEAVSYQSAVVDNLGDLKLTLALDNEDKTITAFKDALEKLKQQRQSPGQNNAQNKQSQNQKKNDNQQKQSANSQQNSEKQPSSSGDQQLNQQSAGKEKEKMTAEEALKELNRLRKHARDEKERRQQQFGLPAARDHLPVDKNW